MIAHTHTSMFVVEQAIMSLIPTRKSPPVSALEVRIV